MKTMLDNIAGPRPSTHRLARAVIWGLAIWMAVPGAAVAGDETPKPPTKSSEELILERIDQLQGQLDELRAALMAVRKEKEAPVSTAATPANSPAPAMP